MTQTALAAALVKTGFPVPSLNKRIWLWLHDHPGKNTKEIAAALHEDDSTIGTAMLKMVARGMVSRKSTTKRRGGPGPKTIYEYSTCIREYELLPIKRTPKPNPRQDDASKTSATYAPSPAVSAISTTLMTGRIVKTPDAPAAPSAAQPIDIEAMPLGQAHHLYRRLHAIFGAA